MTTETTKTLPENISISIVAKYLEENQIKLRVKVINSLNKKEHTFDYGGGLLAFLPREKTEKEIPDATWRDQINLNRRYKAKEIRSLLNSQVNPYKKRVLADEDNINRGKQLALEWLDLNPMGFFNSMISEAQFGEMHFQDFCDELGYNPDSRKDHATWEACGEIARNIRGLLGSQFDEILNLTQDY